MKKGRHGQKQYFEIKGVLNLRYGPTEILCSLLRRSASSAYEDTCYCISMEQVMSGLSWTGPGHCGDFLNCCILKDELHYPEHNHE